MHEPLLPRFFSLLQGTRPAWTPWSRCSHRTGTHFSPRISPLVSTRGATLTSRRLNDNHDIRLPEEISKQNSFKQQVFDQSIALSRSRMNESTELKCALFNANGSTAFKETRLTKAEVAQQYGIDGRDLRNADLISEGIPHILVRPSAIFISIFTLRLLIQCDGALLFLLDSETDGVKMQDVFEHNLQSRVRTEMGLGSSPSLPFELRVVDAALASVTAILEAEHLILRGEVEKRLQDSKQEDVVHLALRELLEHGKNLVTIEQRARQVRSALQELLNNDDDLATMYLTDRQAGRPHAIEDHQEVEYLLEAYYKNADAIAESSGALVDEVNRTARAIQSILDVRRNQIMIFEAHIEIWMLGFAVSTFVAGLIGMNVVNYMEHTPYAIVWLASGCVIATLLISRIGMWKLRKVRKMQL
ncbi:Magnesium transporter MRS2/LPE10 [Penicillium odoratum]|uniref:Magnesium transporter MRS2/LPE10 n=1 Tax=Penicillium odoratum TaxID=1167516 RepID=UPI002546F2C1|nr:Magnesium transporter MRS2/LPE10 [Penicillium odoratum]KAJ5752490.1 Magnesium transporter MRS2/LPE10 [Penicillium odoratum]